MPPTNVRFPDALDRELAEYARRTGAPKSTVIVGAVREWLLMQELPGLVFRTTNTGERRAALAIGPQVWTVAAAWLDHERPSRSPAVVADALGLPAADVELALAYWARNRAEIDAQIADARAAQNEALEAWEQRRALDAL
ncbi:MAG: hypothetical protein ACT4QG_20810 [Sporichthyaceae bacterium]